MEISGLGGVSSTLPIDTANTVLSKTQTALVNLEGVELCHEQAKYYFNHYVPSTSKKSSKQCRSQIVHTEVDCPKACLCYFMDG